VRPRPEVLRRTLKRIGRYDVEIGRELFTPVRDRGDVELAGLSIEEATGPIREAVDRLRRRSMR
jgi:formiminoglutamase